MNRLLPPLIIASPRQCQCLRSSSFSLFSLSPNRLIYHAPNLLSQFSTSSSYRSLGSLRVTPSRFIIRSIALFKSLNRFSHSKAVHKQAVHPLPKVKGVLSNGNKNGDNHNNNNNRSSEDEQRSNGTEETEADTIYFTTKVSRYRYVLILASISGLFAFELMARAMRKTEPGLPAVMFFAVIVLMNLLALVGWCLLRNCVFRIRMTPNNMVHIYRGGFFRQQKIEMPAHYVLPLYAEAGDRGEYNSFMVLTTIREMQSKKKQTQSIWDKLFFRTFRLGSTQQAHRFLFFSEWNNEQDVRCRRKLERLLSRNM
eukprot:TRINITY_DN10664_c0_g1_i1.p1 TRINITY_DN10664_c0_g1~~TRINITY_DN10664_c0_g1_i1.p1  ORF type:complete len:312 (+),score=36.34 TRINITY_DN10664_c0_g1_i1:112-1047(+)